MKIRSGFVSNSSSSSFILLGYKLSREETEKLQSEYEYDYCDKVTMTDDGDYYNGIILSKSIDEYLQDKQYSLQELCVLSDQISSQYEVDSNRIKLYIGTRSC